MELTVSAQAFADERTGLVIYVAAGDIEKIPPDGRLKLVQPGQQQRRGRLSREDSEDGRTRMLAMLRAHPTLMGEHAVLSSILGISRDTIRKWLFEERTKYNASRAWHTEERDGQDND
jgi:hypothetical protein